MEIFQESYDLALKIHRLTLKLPNYETYEEGSQIRRSSKSIVINIVEGYGRKRYQNEFIRFLTFALSSCDETKVHLKFFLDLGYISEEDYKNFLNEYEILGRKIYHFIESIEKKIK